MEKMDKEYLKNLNYVQAHTELRDFLEILAEEAAELAQAALKVIRAEEISNIPTPTSAEEARKNLIEEVADVQNCLNALGMCSESGVLDKIMANKMERWVKRLKEKSK